MEELICQLALTLVPNIGDHHARILLQELGSASSIFRTSPQVLEKIEGIGEVRARSIRKFQDFHLAESEARFVERAGVRPLFLNDPAYPQRLLNCYDAPILLFYKGSADLNAAKILAIVGTRSHTEYGRQVTEKLVRDLAQEEVLILSGLAFGIDALAHKAALKNGLPTIGVVGHGLDKVYPWEHRALAGEMLEKGGGLLTEFFSGIKPDKHHFPLRNRIVAGMSDATVVIETNVFKGREVYLGLKQTNPNMKKAAILVRVSTEAQEYERQLRSLKAKAAADGYIVEDRHVYAEKVSGFSDLAQRRELQRLMNDIREHKTDISIIYCAELSRISRQPRIARQIIDEACDLGIPFFIEGIGKTLEEDGSRNMTTSIVIQVFAEYAAKEAAITKVRTKSGKRMGAINGKYIGGAWVPFGFSVEKETKRLLIMEEEAEVVRGMYQMLVDGLGLVTIAKMLDSQKVPTRSGKPWNATVMRHMVINPLYKGMRKYKGELFAGMPQIVSEELWQKAQEAMHERNVNKARNTKYLYLLDGGKNGTGKLHCACCGKRYCAKYHVRKAAHYMCYNRKFGKTRCTNAGIGISQIESLVYQLIRADGTALFHVLKRSSKELNKVDQELKNLILERDALEQQLESKQGEKERTMKLFQKGRITEDRLDQDLEKLDKAIVNLGEKLENVKATIKLKEDGKRKGEERFRFVEKFDAANSSRQAIHEVFQKVVDRVLINSVKPDSMSREYVVTVWAFGRPYGTTVLFDKKTMTYRAAMPTKGLDTEDLYNDQGILQVPMEKVLTLFPTSIPGYKGKGVMPVKPRNIQVIPFSFVNVHPVAQKEAV